MISGIYRSKPVALFLTVLMVFFICQTAYPQAASSTEKKADKALAEGLDLYKAGEYVKAIERFSQVVALSKDNGKLADSYFYLSLSNYFMGETDGAEEWAVKSLVLDPGREASDIYPAGFIELFKKAKRTAGIELDKQRRAGTRTTTPAKVEPAREPEPAPRTPVVQRSREKEGGGSGGLVLILGLLAVGGAVAALLLLKGDKDGGGDDDDDDDEPTLGSIQVNSTPSGARVYLDGADKGTTPLTLSNISVGSHAVRLTKEGYRDYQETVTVAGGQTTTVNATMSKHTISVTKPAAGALWMKGKNVEIKWTTDTSATLGNVFALRPGGGITPASPTRWSAAMARAASAARAAGRGERSTRRGAGAEGAGSAAAEPGEFGPAPEMRSPRLDSLARMSSPGASVAPNSSQARIMVISNVKIELYKGTEQVETIVSSTANDGSFSWEVREGLTNAKNYKIRVSSDVDAGVYGQSGAFEISDGYGTINVKSTPGGATVFLDGKNTGKKTPADSSKTVALNDVSAGTHAVKVEKTGYDSEEQTVTVQANKKVTVTFSLEGFGSIKVTSNPSAATVYLDGADTGKKTPITLDRIAAGTHTVKVEKTDYITDEKTVTVVAGKTATVNFTLKQNGTIKVNSDPPGADVSLNGSATGEVTPCTFENVTPGSYTIKVEKDGYETQQKTVTLAGGETKTVSFTLVKTSIEVDQPDWWSIWGKGEEVEIKWSTGSTAAGWNGLRTERELRGLVPSLRNPLRGDGAGRFAAGARRGGDGADLASPGYDPDLRVEARVRSAGGAAGPQPPAIANVKIELYKGSTLAKVLTESTANDGLFYWTVDEALEDGVDYKVVISDAGGSGATGESMTYALTDVTYDHIRTWGGYGAGNGRFDNPAQIAVDKYGYVYVADNGNDRIQRFTSLGAYTWKWGTEGTLDGQFKSPYGIALDANLLVFVADWLNYRMQRFSYTGLFQAKWGSYGTATSQFNGPCMVALDPYGYVYVTDYYNDRVQKFWQTGGFTRQWGVDGTGNGQFKNPAGIAIDAGYTVYVVDRYNHRIQVFDRYGTFLSKFASQGSGDGQLDRPFGAAVDRYGFLYVVDWGNNRIQKFSPRGLYCCKWGTEGGADGQFDQPVGIAVDSNGYVYVTDFGNDRVQKFR